MKELVFTQFTRKPAPHLRYVDSGGVLALTGRDYKPMILMTQEALDKECRKAVNKYKKQLESEK